MAGEILELHGDTIKGQFLELADAMVEVHLGDRLSPSDGTAWDQFSDEKGGSSVPPPRDAKMLVVTRYEGRERIPERIVGASYLFPEQRRRVKVSAAEDESKYEGLWYLRILEQARIRFAAGEPVGVQAFSFTPSPPHAASGNPYAYRPEEPIRITNKLRAFPLLVSHFS